MGSYLDSKISLDDTIFLLPQNQQLNIRLFLDKSKTNPRWYATNSFAYKYNGKSIYRLNFSKPEAWRINLTLDKQPNLDETLLALPEDLRNFYFKHLRKCKHCNPGHGDGRRFVILGNEYFGCGEPEIEVVNPSTDEIDILCKFVEMQKNIIKQLNKVITDN